MDCDQNPHFLFSLNGNPISYSNPHTNIDEVCDIIEEGELKMMV